MSIIIAICGRFSFEALNLPKDMESLSKNAISKRKFNVMKLWQWN